jgi:hypothetical protein
VIQPGTYTYCFSLQIIDYLVPSLKYEDWASIRYIARAVIVQVFLLEYDCRCTLSFSPLTL